MAIKLPHVAITQIPNNRPAAVPALWNSRYAEINANNRALESFVAFADIATGGAEAAKTGTCENFNLLAGASVFVRFAQTNTAKNATLNLNKTGAKPIVFNGNPVPSGLLEKGCVYPLVYDGSQWIVTGGTASMGTAISPTIQAAIDAGDVYGKGVHAAFLAFNQANQVR